MRRFSFLLAVLLCVGHVYAAQVYRWVDKSGHVQYSDQPPPADAKKAEQRKIGENVIDGQDSYALKQAVAKAPVVLFTTDCGQYCDSAKAFLDKRGIPYTTKDPKNNKADTEALMALVGVMEVPVLKVGKKPYKGFEESRWNAALDEAGYPKSSQLRDKKPDAPAKPASPQP
jgi:glutaredoxin